MTASLYSSRNVEFLQSDIHDDVIKWKYFPRYWPFVREIHRSPVNFPHKGQWRRALMFTLICARKNGWVNNGVAGDLRRYLAHYDVIVMWYVEFVAVPRHIVYLCSNSHNFPINNNTDELIALDIFTLIFVDAYFFSSVRQIYVKTVSHFRRSVYYVSLAVFITSLPIYETKLLSLVVWGHNAFTYRFTHVFSYFEDCFTTNMLQSVWCHQIGTLMLLR